mmetsp:Transcript_23782/g.67703  ORF Transcript_23782/g.67703 Transcript_23782/m.67703 type:complete len:264 (-) Transcript_23782:32-823(-)
MARLRGLNPPLQLLFVVRGVAEREQRFPPQQRHLATAGDGDPLAVQRLETEGDERLQARAILALRQCLRQALDLAPIFDDDDASARVHDLIRRRIRRVCGIYSGALPTCERRCHRGDDPLGGIEAPNVHGLEALHPERHEGLRHAPHVCKVGCVCPSRPRLPGKRRRHHAVDDGGHRALYAQRRSIAVPLGGSGQELHQGRRGRELLARDARRRKSRWHLGVGEADGPWARALVEHVLVALLGDRRPSAHFTTAALAHGCRKG